MRRIGPTLQPDITESWSESSHWRKTRPGPGRMPEDLGRRSSPGSCAWPQSGCPGSQLDYLLLEAPLRRGPDELKARERTPAFLEVSPCPPVFKPLLSAYWSSRSHGGGEDDSADARVCGPLSRSPEAFWRRRRAQVNPHMRILVAVEPTDFSPRHSTASPVSAVRRWDCDPSRGRSCFQKSQADKHRKF